MKRRLLLQLAVLLVSLGGACAGDFENRINEKRWIREYYNEVIQKRDRHVLLEYVPLIKEEPYYIDYSPDGETTVYWYDDFPRKFDRVSCSTEPAIGGLEYMNIIRIWGKLEYLKVNKLNPNLYEVWIKDIGISQYSYERELKYGHNLEFALSETEYPLYFKFDGEYLSIYLKDQKTLFSTYCAYDETEYQALVEAIAANVFDMSKFTFPRHADGTCDYDDVDGIAPAAANENQGMEDVADAPATERAESVEEAALPEVSENEPSNDETAAPSTELTDADAKQNAALPVLPIAAGDAALAILLAVVLLAVKKRKAGKE